MLYLRQSTSREESISLELQEHEGRAYCERQGYDIIAVEADPGISGRTWNRPAVRRVMSMIEQREAEVVVLWKWSRLSRSRLDWAVAVDKVEAAGGSIESATEPLDTTTATGRFARGMLTEFAAFESERMGDVWKEAHARRVRAGLPINGKPRFGYSYDRATGFTPDPITAPVLAEAFRRYLGGESVYSLIAWLNAGPTRPVGGYGVKSDGLWSDRTLRRVMDSGFAAGFIRVSGEMVPGAHEPLVTPAEWDAYREARQRRSSYRRTERSEYLLSGLIWCECGSKMHAGQFGHARVAKFRCKDAHEKRTHSGGYVTESVVDAEVYAWLVERNERITAELRSLPPVDRRPRPVADPGAAIRRRIAAVDAKMDALTDRLIDAGIPQDSYARTRDRLAAERAALEAELLTVEVRATKRPVAIIPDLLANWHDLEIPERRELLRALIERVVITPGRPQARVEIVGRD